MLSALLRLVLKIKEHFCSCSAADDEGDDNDDKDLLPKRGSGGVVSTAKLSRDQGLAMSF